MNGGIHGSERRMALQLHFSSEERVLSVHCLLCILCFVSGCFFFFILFYFICGIYVANAFRTSVYGTLVANYLRWVVILSCLHFRYGVAVTLVVPFLCERK